MSNTAVLNSKSKHNRERFDMKHKLTVVLCVVAIAIASIATVQSYEHYQAWRTEQNAKATKASAAMAHQNAIKQANFNAQVKRLQDQCAADKAAYNTLPAAQKAKTPAPQCDVNLVQ